MRVRSPSKPRNRSKLRKFQRRSNTLRGSLRGYAAKGHKERAGKRPHGPPEKIPYWLGWKSSSRTFDCTDWPGFSVTMPVFMPCHSLPDGSAKLNMAADCFVQPPKSRLKSKCAKNSLRYPYAAVPHIGICARDEP